MCEDSAFLVLCHRSWFDCGRLAGGARRRIPFFARAKKGTKENTPRCRRNPEDFRLGWAAKELAALKQLSPAFGSPSQTENPRLRQRGGKTHTPSSSHPSPRRKPGSRAIDLLDSGLRWNDGFCSPRAVANHRITPPLSRQFFRTRSGEVGEHCLSPQGELRSRPNGFGKIGHPKGDEAGRAFFGYFLCTSKESNAPARGPRPTTHHPA